MLTLQDFFRSLNKLQVTVEKQAECFGVSTTTISYWITGKRNPKKPETEIFEGAERCRAYLRSDQQRNVDSWKNIVSVVGTWKGSVALCSDGTCVATGLNAIGSGEIFRWTQVRSARSTLSGLLSPFQ